MALSEYCLALGGDGVSGTDPNGSHSHGRLLVRRVLISARQVAALIGYTSIK